MASEQSLLITDQDYERLSLLTQHAEGEAAAFLDEELGRATIVAQKEIPADVVTMNSRVRFLDEETGKESEMTLVYPQDANVTEGKISVLVPVGTALIGLRIGQSIDWPMPKNKQRKLKVVAITFQPEASGDWKL
ncbi:MAG: nucleoside diphosphate kinase regulator [Bdellovibrionaceae bacterium]|nr:nucleoside diphosphate kinase regulator [Pseudobdellovibrionaceae bacterium]